MSEIKTDLLPCPFCGSEAVLEERNPFCDDEPRYIVRCTNTSDCCIEQGYTFTLEEAIEAWNSRK